MKNRLSETVQEILGEGKDIVLTEMLQGEQKSVFYYIQDVDENPIDITSHTLSTEIEYFRCGVSGAGKSLKIKNIIIDDDPPTAPGITPEIVDAVGGVFKILIDKNICPTSDVSLIEDSAENAPLIVIYVIIDDGVTITKERYCIVYRHSL